MLQLHTKFACGVACYFLIASVASAQEFGATVADQALVRYFEQETVRLRDQCLTDVGSLEDWQARKPELRRQLLEMLGLDPLPAANAIAAQD